MRWKIVLEGTDEFGSAHRSELTIDKDLARLSAGEIGFSVEDGKAIMAHLQQAVVKARRTGWRTSDPTDLAAVFAAQFDRLRSASETAQIGAVLG